MVNGQVGESALVTLAGYMAVILIAVIATTVTAGSMGPFATITVAALGLGVLAAFDRRCRDDDRPE